MLRVVTHPVRGGQLEVCARQITHWSRPKMVIERAIEERWKTMTLNDHGQIATERADSRN